jgi:DNA-binding CsgD family transcriptional regulator/tetratricopeptide (TPR) repeat protein
VLEALRAGESPVLVVRGEPGVGKTALLDYLVERASWCRVVRAVGIEAEMELAYAALHQLCAPMLDRLDRLPAPQRDALGTAFGLSAGEAPDRFLVGLAVLSLLSEVAEEQPVLCLVDDAQWLDRASAHVLTFVARRLLAESVAIVFSVREPSEERELAGLPELVVEGLRDTDARALLDSVITGPLDTLVRDRIIAETRGNPLALLELPRGLTPAELAGGFGLPDAASLPTRIEGSFLRRVERMPAETQRLLLIAAAEPIGDPTLLRQAAGRLGVNVDAAMAGADDLIALDSRVRFRHPLVRSAVYRFAPPVDRRPVHAALAESIPPGVDPDRRVWHLAHAADGPDEAVAAELEVSADRAQARGGLAAAAAFLDRAVELTPDPRRRAQRALAAAQAAHTSGAADAALALLVSAGKGPLDEIEDARRQLLEAQIAFTTRRGRDAASLLVAAAQRLEPLDGGLARASYLQAIWAASFANHLGSGSGALGVAAAARAASPVPEPRSPADLMLDGLAARYVEGFAAGAPTLRRALTAFGRRGAQGVGDMAWVWVAVDLWDADAWFELGARQVQTSRDAGALTVLPLALHTLAAWHVLAGEFAVAETLLSEADSIMEATGDAPMSHARIGLAALQGRDAEAIVSASIRDATARGEGILVRHAEHAAATHYNGLGRYHHALRAAQRELEHNPAGFYMTALPELVEAAVHCGDLELARRAVARLSEQTQASGTNWALGVEARSRALTSDGDQAEALYRRAIDLLGYSRLGVECARAQLVYGEWLRRERRRRDAREQLHAAHERFTTMGAGPFAERTARELRASGETARKRTVETSDQLTPQEAQIAGLARDGLSNPEIGARLFISPRTVEYHLHKVFAKLNISSRMQLGRILSEPGRGSATLGRDRPWRP